MTSRNATLDGFRSAAIIIVLISHAGLGHLVPGGLGVTIFFFLSGYLITSLMIVELNAQGNISLYDFYRRRVIRIIPPMIVAIIFTTSVAAIGLIPPVNYAGIPLDLAFLTNYTGGISQIRIPLWSLDVEEHFYLIFPLIFAFCSYRMSLSRLSVLLFAICTIVLAIRFLIVSNNGNTDLIYYQTHTRIDSILFGCILACWNNPLCDQPPLIDGRLSYLIVGIFGILVTLAIREPDFRETVRYTLQGLALFLVFNYALRSRSLEGILQRIRLSKVIAQLSYFLYLIHVPMFQLTGSLTGSNLTNHLIALLGSFALAAVVRQTIELPLLKWRKAIEQQRTLTVLPT